MIEFQQTIPILRIFDVPRAKDFYLGFLGFATDWEHRFEPQSPLYTQVSRGSLLLHLSEHHGDCCPGSTVFVWMTEIEAFHAEIMAKGYEFARPALETTFYNTRAIQVTDPFGNRIRFNQRLES